MKVKFPAPPFSMPLATMPDWISTGAVFSPCAAGATRRHSGLPAAGPAGAFSRKGPLERPSGWVRSRVAPLFTPQRARPASLHISPVTSQRFGNASHVKPLTATDALNNRIDRQLKGRHVRADGSNARAGHRAPSRRGPRRSPQSRQSHCLRLAVYSPEHPPHFVRPLRKHRHRHPAISDEAP